MCERFRPILPVEYSRHNAAKPKPPNDLITAVIDEEEEEKFAIPPVVLDAVDIMEINEIMADEFDDSENIEEDAFQYENDSDFDHEPQPTAQEENIGVNASHELQGIDGQINDDVVAASFQEAGIVRIDENPVASSTHNDKILSQMPESVGNMRAEVLEGGQIRVTKIIDEDIEMSYMHGEEVRPNKLLFKLKANDSLSGTLAYHEYVCCYYIF